MPEPAKRVADWEDLLATPDGERWEVIDGELESQPSPHMPHGLAQGALAGELTGPFYRGRGGPGGWWIVTETAVRLSRHDIVAPDISGWRRERLPVVPRQAPVDVVPDWVCEVLSPTSLRRDRLVKAALYLRAGVPHYWILDSDARTLEAFSAREAAWLRIGAWSDGEHPRIPPFDAIELDVGALFPPLP